jgi:hypothetical protein
MPFFLLPSPICRLQLLARLSFFPLLLLDRSRLQCGGGFGVLFVPSLLFRVVFLPSLLFPGAQAMQIILPRNN